jgi:hypothetical protein
VLVEGLSEKALLRDWLPRFLPRHTFTVIHHEGKGTLPRDPGQPPDPKRRGLLDQLPAKLRAYGEAFDSATDRVLVLVDADKDDCTKLKSDLVALLDSCPKKPTVLFRIAIEETEAFYLGDPSAIRKAFPQAKIHKMKLYRQDGVCGTWELFMEVIGARRDDKRSWAEQMAPHLTINWRENQSPSFQSFCKALLSLTGERQEGRR